ncbi:hypothetical protein [Nannocystis radixulma]|uniref:TraB/GumN family protein n=1 Tax=Nannocystis radixulma TaxID=2995305 RepID=A0ABT5B8S4_9BACT|nr:hypothetical protein [Nannocystis radixulma]MDC0670517.1 hypothetical protein [Nannocystis radixulma]
MLLRRRSLLALLSLAACRRGRSLSFAEYAALEHDTPYVLRFARGRGALLFFGTAHTYDPSDRQVAQIEARLAEFGPTLAFNEGGDPPTEATVAAAVSQHGESGLLRFLARRDGVPVASIEPPLREQVRALRESGFADEQIKLFFVLRQVPQHRERTGAAMDAVRLAEVLRYFTEATAIAGLATPDELAATCARLLPGLRHWSEVPQAWFDPVFTRPPAFTNVLSARTSEVRDAWVVDLLTAQVRRGERVFAVMGASHVVVQEPALRARLGRPEHLA